MWRLRFLFPMMFTFAVQASDAPRFLPVRHYRFSTVDKDAQMWSALYIASNGKIYVGLCTHADAANLCEFDPRTETMRHLANLTELNEERGHGIWTNGKISGEFERSCKLHTYDLGGRRGFAELGPFAVDRSPYYSRRAYQFDAIAVGPGGIVFCGESDRGGMLFLYLPGAGPFKGGLNPANPETERQRKDTPGLIPERL